MDTNVEAAVQYVYANARVLDRHRLGLLMGDGKAGEVVAALRAYLNPVGGFGHALEPDIRAPGSEPAATLNALETLIDIGEQDHPMVADAAGWIATVARPDGSVPQMMNSAAGYPHAPFINPGGPTFLTFALAGALWRARSGHEWLARATTWAWAELEQTDEVDAYTIVFALRFLDAVPDDDRAVAVLDRIRPQLGPDGSIPVAGGIEGERVTPLDLSPRKEARSRALFTQAQVDADLDRLQREQLDDGGWDFDFLHWSPGQVLDWRGSVTVSALETLHEHRRIDL